uniref:Troponin T n=1 Tax=Macrostomum lignano TaxID=282301 RepID=A0A1I8FPY2_9PLAT
ETDYLGLVFHMYDSEDDEDEEAIERQRQEAERRQRDAERQKRLDALLAEKNEFSPGFWNTRAIFMGGLGRDPELPEEAEAAERRRRQQQQRKLKQEADRSGCQQQQKGGKSTAPPLVFKTRHTSGTAPILLRQATAKSAQKSAVKGASAQSAGAAESIWSALQFPDRLRLDMVIKYSKLPDLEAALAQWELTVAAILRRESILAELEAFERAASDPARFRARGHRGSSQARLEESAKREGNCWRGCSGADEAGRPYSDKMRWDKIEMLYWLQEERRRPMESLAEASPRSRARRRFCRRSRWEALLPGHQPQGWHQLGSTVHLPYTFVNGHSFLQGGSRIALHLRAKLNDRLLAMNSDGGGATHCASPSAKQIVTKPPASSAASIYSAVYPQLPYRMSLEGVDKTGGGFFSAGACLLITMKPDFLAK